MERDEYGGIAVSSSPAQGGRDEYGGIAVGSAPAPAAPPPAAPAPTVDQKFQADPAIQQAADGYVQQKWQEYGKAAQQSEGQAIRDFTLRVSGLGPQDGYQPEKHLDQATAYVKSTVDTFQRDKLENQWRKEYLANALPQAVDQQTEAANKPVKPDVGIIHGQVDALAKGLTDTVVPQVKAGTELFYGLGSHSGGDGLNGATTNRTDNELRHDASMLALDKIQHNIDQAYPKSTAAVNNPGGLADRAENVTEMLPGLFVGAAGFKAGGLQKALALGQMGAQNFATSYDDIYRAAKTGGMNENDAVHAALTGGLTDAAVNTYLMKFGAVGAVGGSGGPILKRVLGTAVKDALAQGGVGLAQGGVSELTKFITTGEDASVEKVFKTAIDNAVAGGVLGLHRGLTEGGHAPVTPEEAQQTKPGEPSAPEAKPAVPVPDAAALDNALVTKAPEPAPVEETKLPAIVEQAGSKHRIHSEDGSSVSIPLEFESPTDKALYSASVARKGKVAKAAETYLSDQGYTPERIAEESTALRERVKTAAEAATSETEPVKIPKLEKTNAVPTAEGVAKAGEEVAPVADGAAPEKVPQDSSRPEGTKAVEGLPAPGGEGRQGESLDSVKPESFLPEKSVEGRDQRDEALGKAMKDAYVVKRGLGAHEEVLNVHKELTGQEAIPYAGGRGRGFRAEDKTFYSVEKNNTPELRKEAIAHEATHWLQDHRPELVAEIDHAIPPETRAKLTKEYEANYRAQEGKNLDPAKRDSEVQALVVGRAFAKFGVARQVMDHNPSAFVRGVDMIVNKLRSLTSGGQLTNQVIATLKKARAAAMENTGRRKSIGLEDLSPDHPIRRGLSDLENENLKLRQLSDRAKVALRTASPDKAFLPGVDTVKKFGEEDVSPAVKGVIESVRKAWDGVKRVFSPASRGAEALITSHVLREGGAEAAQRMDRLHEAFNASKEAMDKMPVADTRDFIHRLETGAKQADPALQPLADALRAVLDDRLRQVQGLGTGKLSAFIKDYFPHLWKDPKAAASLYDQLFSKRPMEGRKSFLKKRTLPLFADGIAKGLEPVTENPVEAVMLRVREMDKYIIAQNEFTELRGKGLAVKVPARKVAEWKAKGYAQVDDNIATIYAPPNRKGGLSIAGYWMAPEPVATVLNNHLSPGLRSHPFFGKAFRTFLGVGNVVNQAQLGLSAFHGTFGSYDAAVGEMALGIEKIGKGDVKGAAKSAGLTATLAGPAINNVHTGNLMLKEWRKPGSTTPEMAIMVKAYKAGGGRAGSDAFYHTDAVEKMMTAFRKGNAIGGVMRAPLAAVDLAAKPIMEGLIPRMKMGAFAELMRSEMEKNPGMTHDELRAVSAKAVDSVDNRLGQMVYDNLFMNKMAKDLLMASTRSVGWNIGTLRELGGGVVDTAKAGANVARGRFSQVELTHRMAYTLALPVLTGLIGGTATYMMTGKRPEEMKDLFFPKTGQKDKTGHDVRLTMPGYMADVLKYSKDIKRAVSDGKPLEALTTLGHKTHPLINTILEMMQNRDYYGTKIRNEDDPFVKQVIDTAKNVGKSLIPFGLRDVKKLSDEGQGAKSLLPLVGVVRARSDITNTDAENKARELTAESAPHGSRTQAQADHSKLVSDLADSLRTNQPDARDRIRQAFKDGQLQEADVEKIKSDQKFPGQLERSVKSLDAEQAWKVWQVADPGERKRIGPQMLTKIRSSKTLTRDRRVELVKGFQADWAKLKAGPPPTEAE